jgi:hypothetical protein
MDQRDVAQTGLTALGGALSAFGPAGGTLALLALSLAGVLSLYEGTDAEPSPYLSGADVDRIITHNLLEQDVRDAWSLLSAANDWYKEWTVRAKRGEVFTAADLAEFDSGYADLTGPNSGVRKGLAKLHSKPANSDHTPGQYGVPFLILGVGLWIQLLGLGIARTAERGEKVSDGQWEILMTNLQYWMDGIGDCDRLAGYRAQEAVQAKVKLDPSIKPGTPAWDALVKQVEIIYHGGAAADGELPALTATRKLNAMLLSLEAAGHAPAPP